MTDEELLKKYDLLIRKIVNKYYTRMLDKEDLYQEGVMGLLEARKRFDKDRGTRFSTYAYYWIRKYISLALVDGDNLIKIPFYMVDKIRRLLNNTIRSGEKMGIKQSILLDKALSCRYIANIDDFDKSGS
jgi:RNA polymerase sigma factor (sigma-70 family)